LFAVIGKASISLLSTTKNNALLFFVRVKVLATIRCFSCRQKLLLASVRLLPNNDNMQQEKVVPTTTICKERVTITTTQPDRDEFTACIS